MPPGWKSIFDASWVADDETNFYRNEDYALWAYGVRFNEYDKAILAACGISWR